MISPENVRELFDYDVCTGFLNWKVKPAKCIVVGDRAGIFKKRHGYRHLRYKYKDFLEHRVIWLWCNGSWPEHQIDHINGNRTDNRISNLRQATNAQNGWNAISKKKNGGLKGAYFKKQTNRWQSTIRHNGSVHYLGCFLTEEEAHAAYAQAATRLHGEYAHL
jgi:hypothetical protein